MKACVEQHPTDPRRTIVDNYEGVPQTFTQRKIASVFVNGYAAVKQQTHHSQNEKDEKHERLVVPDADIVSNPLNNEGKFNWLINKLIFLYSLDNDDQISKKN